MCGQPKIRRREYSSTSKHARYYSSLREESEREGERREERATKQATSCWQTNKQLSRKQVRNFEREREERREQPSKQLVAGKQTNNLVGNK
jgi:hypothetical protein